MHRIAVVVVNFNSGELLRECLRCLLDQSVPPDRIIVVDNASVDGSDGLGAAFPGVELIRQPGNVGFAAASNVGVRAASDCDWIASLNPDAFVARDWVEALRAAVEHYPGYDSFACRMLDDANSRILDGAGDVYHVSGLAWRRLHGRSDGPAAMRRAEVFSPCAAAALYRRSSIERAGGFDEDLFCYMEDVDLGFRMQLLNMKCLYVPEAVVRHVGSAIAGRRSEFQLYHGHRNLVWVFVKNMPGALLWALLPLHLAMNLLAVLWFAARGRLRVILRAKRDALRGLPAAWRKRSRVQEGRLASLWHIWSMLYKQPWRSGYHRLPG